MKIELIDNDLYMALAELKDTVIKNKSKEVEDQVVFNNRIALRNSNNHIETIIDKFYTNFPMHRKTLEALLFGTNQEIKKAVPEKLDSFRLGSALMAINLQALDIIKLYVDTIYKMFYKGAVMVNCVQYTRRADELIKSLEDYVQVPLNDSIGTLLTYSNDYHPNVVSLSMFIRNLQGIVFQLCKSSSYEGEQLADKLDMLDSIFEDCSRLSHIFKTEEKFTITDREVTFEEYEEGVIDSPKNKKAIADLLDAKGEIYV